MSPSEQQRCQLPVAHTIRELTLMCVLVTQGKRLLSHSEANLHASKFCPHFLNQTSDGVWIWLLQSEDPPVMATCSSFCMTFLLAQAILCTCKSSHLCLPVKQAIVCFVFVPAKILGQMQRLDRRAFRTPSFLSSQSQTHFLLTTTLSPWIQAYIHLSWHKS